MMNLKGHIRAIASFGHDPFTEKNLDQTVREVRAMIKKAKAGDTALLVQDILDIALIFRGLAAAGALDSEKAYPVLRAYVDFILEECPAMRMELIVPLAPFFDLNTTLH